MDGSGMAWSGGDWCGGGKGNGGWLAVTGVRGPGTHGPWHGLAGCGAVMPGEAR